MKKHAGITCASCTGMLSSSWETYTSIYRDALFVIGNTLKYLQRCSVRHGKHSSIYRDVLFVIESTHKYLQGCCFRHRKHTQVSTGMLFSSSKTHNRYLIITMEICKVPTLRLKAPNKHTHIMYIEMENVIKTNKQVFFNISASVQA